MSTVKLSDTTSAPRDLLKLRLKESSYLADQQVFTNKMPHDVTQASLHLVFPFLESVTACRLPVKHSVGKSVVLKLGNTDDHSVT
jgi:hypothetical protein